MMKRQESGLRGADDAPATDANDALYPLTAALGDGKLMAATSCFARDACLVTVDGTAIHGLEAITPLLAQLIARRTRIDFHQLVFRPAGEVIVASGNWVLHSDGPRGSRVVETGAPTMVLRRIDGTWKIAVIALWGTS